MKKLGVFALLAAVVAIGACSGSKPAESVAADKDVYVAKAGETVKIKVSTSYEPKSIRVKKGESVKLEFTRVDDKNCGDEVVFPKLDIKKQLPVGIPVTVELTPTESGDLAFQCGMDMMKGKIVVE
jgi:plastocyanin domain-containing protein